MARASGDEAMSSYFYDIQEETALPRRRLEFGSQDGTKSR